MHRFFVFSFALALMMGAFTAPVSAQYLGMGALPSPPQAFQRSPRFTVRAWVRDEGRPSSLLLLDYLPPVRSQGHQGSCVAWSSAYYGYSYAVAKTRKLTREQIESDKFLFSPSFVYHLGNGGSNEGMPIARAFEILKTQGCATLQEMPYSESDFTSTPPDAAKARADNYRALATGYLFSGRPDVEKLKTFLAEMRLPFVLSIPIYKDFPNGRVSSDFVYNRTLSANAENRLGYHAIAIIGYDDSKQAFRMVNSWGNSWGDQGFLWLSERFLAEEATEGWSILSPGGVKARDPRARVHLETPEGKFIF